MTGSRWKHKREGDGAGRRRAKPSARRGVGGAGVVLLLFGLATLGAAGADAAIYRYVDDEGVIHFTNVPTSVRFRLYIPEKGLGGTAYVRRYDHLIHEASRRYEVDFSLVKAVIKAESDFDHKAVSSAGAQGLMQLMPGTAKELAVQDPFDPGENINAGVRYLKKLLQKFNDVSLAVAAYNAGEQAVTKYGRIPPFQETRNFVDRVLRYWDEFRLQHRSLP